MCLRKAIAVVLVIIILASILSACGKGNERAKNDIDNEQKQSTSTTAYQLKTYTDSFFPFEPGYVVDAVTCADQTIVAIGHIESEYCLSFTHYSIDEYSELKHEMTKQVSINAQAQKDLPSFCGISVQNNTIYLLFGDEDLNSAKNLLVYSSDGKFIKEYNIGELTVDNISGISISQEETLIIFGQGVELVDLDSGEHLQITIDELDYIWAVSSCNPYTVLFGSSSGASLLDVSAKTLTVLDESALGVSICQGYNGECLYYDLEKVYEYDFASNKSNEVFEWNSNNNPGGLTRYVCRLDSNTYIFQGEGSDTITVVGQMMVPYEEPTTVNIAVVSDEYGTVDAAARLVASMNAMFGSYRYVLKEYDETELNRLISEISTNNSPDLLLYRKNVDTSSDYFENLYNYIDNDVKLSRDSFLPGLLVAIETKGELHELWTLATIDTVMIRARDYSSSQKFTTDYCNEIMNSGRYRSVFGTYMSASNLLMWIADISTGAYIDKSIGTCNFTADGFGKMLQWCSKMDLGLTDGKPAVQYDLNDIFLFTESLSSPERLTYLPDIFNEKMIFIGFPNAEGNGSYFDCAGVCMAIPSYSSNKEGAWFFIRNQLLVGSQLSQSSSGLGLPVNAEALSRLSRRYLSTPEYDQFMALANETSKAINRSDEKIRQIIIECGMDYLAGKKTLEDTVSIIQKRASIIVSEKYG